MSIDLHTYMVQYYSVQKRYYRTIKLLFNVKIWHHNVGTLHHNVTMGWYNLVANLKMSCYGMIVSIYDNHSRVYPNMELE